MRAYAASGVAPTVKHFPGLGAATANTDDTSVIIDRGARAIGATDLPPFRAAIAAGAPIVMLSHARYPSLDPAAIALLLLNQNLKLRLGPAPSWTRALNNTSTTTGSGLPLKPLPQKM